jgi:hypothetical protein
MEPQKLILNRSLIVKQSNVITKMRKQFTALETDLLSLIVFELKRAEFKKNIIDFPLAVLQKHHGKELKRADVFRALVAMRSKNVKMQDLLKQEYKVAGIISAAYINESGRILVEIPQMMMQHYIPLENQFTLYQLEQSLNFQSKYTKHLYQLLNQYKAARSYRVGMTELKEILGLRDIDTGEEKLINYTQFKQRVLDTAQAEMIKEDCEIQFTYKDTAKDRKRVTEITFYIDYKPKDTGKAIYDEATYLRLVQVFHLTEYQAREICTNVLSKHIAEVCELINRLYKENKIHSNLGGYTARTFKQKFGLSYHVSQTDNPAKNTPGNTPPATGPVTAPQTSDEMPAF